MTAKASLVSIAAGTAVMVLAVAALAKPPLWDKRVDKAKSRFKVLKKFDSAAVLDKETGLVWQRAPVGSNNWHDAQRLCPAT